MSDGEGAKAPHAGRRVVVAGASGLIGTALVARLRSSGDEVTVLVRRPAGPGEVRWDPARGDLDATALSGADAVVNLSGASIGRLPWTRARRDAILRSRVDATRTLVRGILTSPAPPRALVSGSAAGFYGSRGDEELAEGSSAGEGFLSRVVRAWEAEAVRASDVTRVVLARTGVVVGAGGAMAPLRAMARLGLAGPLGPGTQWWPWIGLYDEAAALDHLIDSGLAGPVNLAGPTAATQAEVSRALARALGRPYGLPAPAFALRLALGAAAEELLLSGQRMVPEALLADGFRFRDETAEAAVVALVQGSS